MILQEKNIDTTNLNENEQTQLFRNILEILKPGESILKAIKRLGNTGSKNRDNLSASQRWIKKKQVDTSQTSDEAKANAIALEKLTSLANKFIEMGYYDVYEETYEKIKLKLDEKTNKKEDEFDMFSDNIDDAALAKGSSGKGQNQIEGKKFLSNLQNRNFKILIFF